MSSLPSLEKYQIHLCVQELPPTIQTTGRCSLLDSYIEQVTKGNPKNDSGFDLFVPNDITLPPGEVTLIDMNVRCAVYKNGKPCPYYLYARSSTPIKYGLILGNSVGIIDCGYRGNLMASFYNFKTVPVKIVQGTRLVQICLPNLSYDFNVQLVDSLDETKRGEGGFGSTGK